MDGNSFDRLSRDAQDRLIAHVDGMLGRLVVTQDQLLNFRGGGDDAHALHHVRLCLEALLGDLEAAEHVLRVGDRAQRRLRDDGSRPLFGALKVEVQGDPGEAGSQHGGVSP